MNRSSRLVAAAMVVIEMEEVLEARIVSLLQILSSSAKMLFLMSRLVQLALGHQLVQPLVQTGLGRLNDLVLDITDHHVESLAGEDLGNIQAHRAAADHYDFLHIM